MVTYLSSYMQDASEVTTDLEGLINKDTLFCGTKGNYVAFQKSKEQIYEVSILRTWYD